MVAEGGSHHKFGTKPGGQVAIRPLWGRFGDRKAWPIVILRAEGAPRPAPHDLHSVPDQLLAQRRQRPVRWLLRQRRRAHEVSEIAGLGVLLKTVRVLADALAGKAG